MDSLNKTPMEHFTNELIDTALLPKFEDVRLTPLQPAYWKIMLFNIIIRYIIIGAVCAAAIYFVEETDKFTLHIVIVFVLSLAVNLFFARKNFKNRGYAFRTHDVIYRTGAISITTNIIPYNRVQHAALHEGWIARQYGLAAVEIFTAGGQDSDIKIPGIIKEEAENIKQLLMGKIINEVSHEE